MTKTDWHNVPMDEREPKPTVVFTGEPDEPVYDEPYDYWNDVEQGRYDDDPNPYHGDYSEW